MAKVYALMKVTGPDGEEHEIGEGFDWPRNTDREKADFDRATSNGIVSTSAPDGATEGEQRTSPRDRRGRTGES